VPCARRDAFDVHQARSRALRAKSLISVLNMRCARPPRRVRRGRARRMVFSMFFLLDRNASLHRHRARRRLC